MNKQSSPATARILRELPQLSTTELQQIRERVAFLLGTSSSTSSHKGDDWLLPGLTQELRRRGLWASNGLPTKLLPSGYSAKAAAVQEHLLSGCVAVPRNGERMALGALAGEVLMDYLPKIHCPVSPKSVLQQIEKVPVALEESFPGYWVGKRLGFCIQMREAKGLRR